MLSNEKRNSDLNVFRLLRIARNKKVKDLANELSVTPAYINAIEKGERTPSLRLIQDYAQALGVNVDTILAFSSEEQDHPKFETALLKLLQIICKLDSANDTDSEK